MKDVKIRDIKVFHTKVTGRICTVVKVLTSEPGLYGLGCASFTQRFETVGHLIEHYIKPLVIGKSVHDINELWSLMNFNAYWRNGGVENNAISGIDIALWDIKGKIAGLPLYQLLGGRVRAGAEIYGAAEGDTFEAIDSKIDKYIEKGYKSIRVGYKRFGKATGEKIDTPENAPDGDYYNPEQFHHDMVALFTHLRDKYGYGVKFAYDIHGRLEPTDAVSLAKALEPYRLFYLEDPLPPEHIEWFKDIRRHCTTPIAMGEIFNNPAEYRRLIAEHDIDFIRCHVSQIGGLTPAIKLAHFAEPFGVRTAWHGPEDSSPVVHMAQLHLDVASVNFGIQEWPDLYSSDAVKQAFPGIAQPKNGYVDVSDAPGLGIDFNEEVANEFPAVSEVVRWTQARLPDGTLHHP